MVCRLPHSVLHVLLDLFSFRGSKPHDDPHHCHHCRNMALFSLSYFLFSESAVSLCIILYFLLLRFYFLVIRHRCWCIVSYSSSVFVLSRPHYFCDEFSFAAVVVDVILGRYMCLWTLFISEVLLLLLLSLWPSAAVQQCGLWPHCVVVSFITTRVPAAAAAAAGPVLA